MPLTRGGKISRARSLLLEAMVDTTRWPAALEATAEACGARAGQLIALDAAHQPTGHWISGMPEDFPTLLETYGFANPRANPRFAAGLKAPIMALVADQDYADANTRRHSRIYQDIYEPHDLTFNCQVVLMRDENAFVRASVTRSTKQGPLDEHALRAFGALLPHLHAAIRVQETLALNERTSILRTLDALDAIAVLLNDDGRVCSMSRPAAVMLERGDVARIHARRIKFANEDDDKAVAAALLRTLSSSNDTANATSAILLSSHLAVEVHPLPRAHLIIAGSAAALMIVRAANKAERLRMLQDKYLMTVAEASVAAAIVDGCTVNEIAKQRNASVATVRSQVQAVFAKVGVRRQSDLVRMWSIKT